jgi:putative phosphoribosyl transferase
MAVRDHEEVQLPLAGGITLQADLTVPERAFGLVAFAHGSGSGRHSPRNRFVASGLQDAGLATLLLDLLTEEEERVDMATRQLRFDIELLAGRLERTIDWLQGRPEVGSLAIGLFGSSTGAGAALIAAGRRIGEVAAVVSRGGRPDLAGEALPRVIAPTLLVVGGEDEIVIDLNRTAMHAMTAEVRLEVVPGATHLFEEPGKLERVVALASGWFEEYLQPA